MKRALVLSLVLGACSEAPSEVGSGEPFRVASAQFVPGELPGSAPSDAADVAPNVTGIDNANAIVQPGQSDKQIGGRATPDSVAVAMRFPDAGSGYWVVQVDAPDPQSDGDRPFAATLDFSRSLGAGFHNLRLAAIDANGHAGTQTSLKLCMASAVPDNGHACDPTKALPAAVVSLTWDTNVDLDLQVTTPAGLVIDGKHPTGSLTSGSAGAAPDPSVGQIDRDSNAACAIDGLRREDVIFSTSPANGTYLIGASLFAACGESSVRFEATLWLPRPTADGDVQLTEVLSRTGELTADDATGGATPGLYLTDFSLH